MAGYVNAIEYGTTCRVVNAHDHVRKALQATSILEVLADSDDIGSLLLALLALPAPTARSRHV